MSRPASKIEVQAGDAVSSVEELLSLHDETFVRCAYATLLGREADPQGLRHFLGRIRNGDSRSAILADIRLSPEGRQRERVLPGLDRAIRLHRLRRQPVLGPLLRLFGVGNERVDLRRQLAVIEAKLHALARIVQLSGAAEQAAKPRVRSAEHRLRKSTKSKLTWRVRRERDETQELSLSRVEVVRALAELGLEVAPASPGVAADATALFASPPLQGDARGESALLVGHDWEESGYPVEWIDDFNADLRGVGCASSHTSKVLLDHGISVPVSAIGLGVDHWERVFASPDYRAPGKGFRFLHVSSCGPGKGTDLLLESFGRMFRSSDDVSLIIKPSGATPQELLACLDRLRESNPRYPDVVLIEGNLTDADLKALYKQCHAFAAPSRAEGFALPIAQALLSGLPVVTTAWGGHCDYCDETNSWLVDYRFQHARTPNDLIVSVWVEPTASSLDEGLRAAYRASPEDRSARALSGRNRLLRRFTWKDAALRLITLAEREKNVAPAAPGKFRTGWITTWNVKCGIFTHVEHLVEKLPADDFVIFAAIQEPRTRPDEPNCVRIWETGKEKNHLENIARELEPRSIGALVIQFNYGFFNHFELNEFIDSALAKGIVVIVDIHSTVDPFGERKNYCLADLAGSLRKCHRILAHKPADMDRLKALGLVDNVMLLPAGILNRGPRLAAPAQAGVLPLIASFGFCLPNKGLSELVEAVALLKQQGRPVRLRMVNAEHPADVSAAEVRKIRELIEQRGLQNEVEMRTEFLEDDVCLALLGEADLVVSPYQHSGESASGSVRYGLSARRPVAVTPVPIFDDLGDAVFRMPGTAPLEMAQGIASALKHVAEGSETARRIQEEALRWVEAHDFAQQGIRLVRTARALVQPQKVARGVFINTADEACSIYESGRMVYNCISESADYTLDYFSLDMLNVPALANEGRIELIDKSQSDDPIHPGDYDFWVFNWHFITMQPHVNLESIKKLPGLKFSILLEVEPGNPLKLVPADVFDGYIALDPTAPATGKIFPFPRPLEGDPRTPDASPRDVPVIGSFGFGTPGKGFELLIEAVNREFDRAIVRINVPTGTHTSATDVIHWQPYPKHIAALCKKIAKPGIDVRFTHKFMSPDELVDWCGENDLNCFMYTRRQPGLSATTDQAIMSGRPLLTLSNDTFRHIHRYIPPYPVIGLREAIQATAPSVQRLQRDWSREAFGETFKRMLAAFGLIRIGAASQDTAVVQDEGRATIMVASRRRSDPDDISWYPARVADSLARTGNYDVLRANCADLAELEEQVAKLQPSAVIMSDFPGFGRDAIAAALKPVAGPKILLVDEAQRSARSDDGLVVMPRRPVIPYFTSSVGLHAGAPAIWLVGFSARDSNLEEVIAKIGREIPKADFFLEVPDNRRAEFQTRVSKLRGSLFLGRGEPLPIHGLPAGGEYIIANFAVSHLAVFYNDPERTEELESISSLAMTTERSVAFTRAAPFPNFASDGTFVEDRSIADIIAMGMSAQIKLYHQFGEWQFFAAIQRLLSGAPGEATDKPARPAAAAREGALSSAASSH